MAAAALGVVLPLQPPPSFRLVTEGSCNVLLILSGVLIAIDDDTVETAAAIRVALPPRLPLRSLGRRGGQLHYAACP